MQPSKTTFHRYNQREERQTKDKREKVQSGYAVPIQPFFPSLKGTFPLHKKTSKRQSLFSQRKEISRSSPFELFENSA